MNIDRLLRVQRGLIFLLFPGVAVLSGCGRPPAPPPDTRAADIAAIRGLHDQLTSAQNAGDASVFEQTAASDILVFPPDGALVAGRQALIKLNEDFFRVSTTLFDNKSEEIVASGDWGFDRGTYRHTQTPRTGGATVVTEGNYFWLAHRESDGMWRHARIIWNTRQPPVQSEDR